MGTCFGSSQPHENKMQMLTNNQMARNRRNLRESGPNSPGDSDAESSGDRSPRSPVGNDVPSRRNGKASDEVELRP